MVCYLSLSVFLNAQKIAVLSPESNAVSENISSQLSSKLNSLDSDLVANAFRSTTYENIFNLSTSEAKSIGKTIGCEFFVIVKADNFKRSSFAKGDYFESFAAIYLVNSRTGHLIFWKLYNFEDAKIEIANEKLFASINTIVIEIKDNLKSEKFDKPIIEEMPADDKNFRSPLPYKRLKPLYTEVASLFLISATVDIEVDLDEKGKITRTEIIRWAGFGLDESVTEIVNKMDWRPALKNGKPLPIRVLLRYNFKKIEKE
jgi:Gram-negative bacterial TonB protein C-terminal